MPIDLSQWSEQRHVARNRVQKAMAQTRVFANEIVQHFSEEACQQIAKADEKDVGPLITAESQRLQRDALKEQQEDVQRTFAMAAVAEAARGDKSPEELVKAIIDTDSTEAIVALLIDLEEDVLMDVHAVGLRLVEAVEVIKEKRSQASEPPKPEAGKPKTAEPPKEAPAKPAAKKKSAKTKKATPDASEDEKDDDDVTS